MNDEPISPNDQRGSILLEQGRFPEAERFFREALAQNPNDPFVLWKLAVCEINQQRPTDALDSIQRAIGLAPEVAHLHALKAIIEVDLQRIEVALASAAEALALDPECDDAFTALAAAHLAQRKWGEAEAAARAALALNPDHSVAANQLAHALRFQNRLNESADQIQYMLGQDPENADAHAAAGWTALQRGERRPAENHFLEALRLEPGNEGAREGLKEAFRAKSPVYRTYLKWTFFMQRFTEGKQWFIIIGLVLMVKIGGLLLGPFAGILLLAYLMFVLWVHVARPVGNLQMTLDRFARHALDRRETIEAWTCGGGVVFGGLLFIAGVVTGSQPALIGGATLIGAAFPLAYTFTNRRAGKWFFAAIAALVLAAGLANLAQTVAGTSFGTWVAALTSAAGLGVLATTWLANVNALVSRR